MQKEIWRDVKGFEGRYLVSNYGNIKTIIKGNNLILKPGVCKSGYLNVRLFQSKKGHSRYVHQLVAIAFLNHIPNRSKIVVDHIDNDKSNNNLNNLQIISCRENTARGKINKNKSSKFIGVCFHKPSNMWFSRILINGNRKFLGAFKNEYDAHLAYQKALNDFNNN